MNARAESHLKWPLSLATGATSAGSSASVYSVKPSGTFQMKTLPSSEADEMSESLKGDLWVVSTVRQGSRVPPCQARAYQSVSRTAAVWPRKRGSWSGALPRSLMGMTAKAPPPLDSQLTEMYSGLA